MAQKYYSEDIIRMAGEDPKTLTPYQRSLVRDFNAEIITPAMLSYHTGIDESQITHRIRDYNGYGINAATIRYIKDYGFIATTNPHPRTGKTKSVIFYIIRGGTGQDGYFGDEHEIQDAKRLIERGPAQKLGCLADAYELIIPLKREDEEKKEKQFSDQAIVRLKGQVQYSAAADARQRALISYMRQHPDATLAQFNASRR
jgi:hypothetical protein